MFRTHPYGIFEDRKWSGDFLKEEAMIATPLFTRFNIGFICQQIKSVVSIYRIFLKNLGINRLIIILIVPIFLLGFSAQGSVCFAQLNSYVAQVSGAVADTSGSLGDGLLHNLTNQNPLPIKIARNGGYLQTPKGLAKAKAQAGANHTQRTGFISAETISLKYSNGMSLSQLIEAIYFLTLKPPAIMVEFNIKSSGKPPLLASYQIRDILNTLYEMPVTQNKINKDIFWLSIKPIFDVIYIEIYGSTYSIALVEDFDYSKIDISYKWYNPYECFAENFDEAIKCGVKISVCNSSGGFGVIRDKNGNRAFIGRCAYDPAENDNPLWYNDNESYISREGGYRWINYNLDKTTLNFKQVDVYSYDPCSDILKARSYKSFDELKSDIDPQTKALMQTKGTEWYNGGPPTELTNLTPPQLLNVETSGSEISKSFNVINKSLISNEFFENGIHFSPGSSVNCLNNQGAKWSYGLIASNYMGGMVAQGDTITIEGPGINGGGIEGIAATPSYGAWQVKENVPGKIVFEAGIAATFTGLADSFFVLGKPCTISGEVNYRSKGNWIGSVGVANGPVFPQGNMSWLPLLLIE